MDIEKIIGVIVWIVIMVVGFATDAYKKRKEKEKQQVQAAQQARSSGPMLWYEESPQLVSKPEQKPIAIKKQRTVVAQPVAEKKQVTTMVSPFTQQASTLPVEGERVTARTKAKAKTKTNNELNLERGLHNKEDLRRAIILGEILAPKF